jgi:hypothetical protein
MMRESVRAFLHHCPLPTEEAPVAEVEAAERLIGAIETPLNDQEAEALLACFGPDACFGLAWSLLHLIETSPTAFPQVEPETTANPWVRLLWERQQQGDKPT